MTPKEKAAELISSFRKFTNVTDSQTDKYNLKIEKEKAKECAKITADTVINIVENVFHDDANVLVHYWEEVKIEIILL